MNQAGWKTGTEGEIIYTNDGVSTMYTLSAPVQFEVMNLYCNSGTCKRVWTEKDWNVFPCEESTYIADEIGWAYKNLASKSDISFTGFCEHMDFLYKLRDPRASFLSSGAFTEWYSSWESNLDNKSSKRVVS